MASEKRLIDAYALMDCIRDSKRHNPHDDPTVAKNHMFEHDHFMKMVSLAPTVNAVEVVHGQWIEILSGQNSSGYECSICKRIVSVVSDVDLRERVLAKKHPYCHCGAKMDGGADNGI